ncbi:hypothetical protein Acid345_2644 [Candidatus Koribacter versatilis Ellin345]|uniref:Teneurin NHL domain-containing protein n=2 Tax=Candidatus Korobacter versatilis TaxID=658062 RepID=Q1INA5_KORVE|nr:hypothetical protein Acid345_2644 [Candidatus Koribacter versatilis Ellin345]
MRRPMGEARSGFCMRLLLNVVIFLLLCVDGFAQLEAHNPWVQGRRAPDDGLVPECKLKSKYDGFLGVAADPDGRAFFIAENCVYTVTDLGIVRIFGGKNTPYTPKRPRALLVDADDNITLLDDNGLTRLYPDGQKYTLLADASKVSGLAADGNGNTFYTVSENHQVYMLDWDGKRDLIAGNGKDGMTGDGRQAREARLHEPTSLALDRDGNVYIVDGTLVRVVNGDGYISTLVGNIYGGLDTDGIPAGYAASPIFAIAVDDDSNVYLGESECIRVVDHSGYVRLFLGKGPYGERDDNHLPAAIRVRQPVSITIAGDLMYFVDAGPMMVRRIGSDGYVTTLAGNKGTYDPVQASGERDPR